MLVGGAAKFGGNTKPSAKHNDLVAKALGYDAAGIPKNGKKWLAFLRFLVRAKKEKPQR